MTLVECKCGHLFWDDEGQTLCYYCSVPSVQTHNCWICGESIGKTDKYHYCDWHKQARITLPGDMNAYVTEKDFNKFIDRRMIKEMKDHG